MLAFIFAATIALTNATCVDRAGHVTRRCTVIVSPGKAAAISPGSSVRRPVDRTIDLRGRWIVPGYVDNHVHLGRVSAARIWINEGVTSLVDNGSDVSPVELALRYEGGPKIEACGPIITKRGGYPAIVAADAPALEVSGSDDAERATADLIRRKHPACVKIAIERGFLPDGSVEDCPALNQAEVQAIVKAARRRGLRVRAHVTQRNEFDLAVRSGVAVIAHSPVERLGDASLREALRREVTIVSTVALWPPELRTVAVENLIRYAAMGGPIAIGSDYPNWKTPGLPREELRALNAAGMQPIDLLVALTRNTVHPARRTADLVVLRHDPHSSIDALGDIDFVVRDGVIIKRAAD